MMSTSTTRTVTRFSCVAPIIGALAFLAFAASPTAAALDQEQQYDECRSKGGEVAVCCIAVGADYKKMPSGNEVCVFDAVFTPVESGATSSPTKPKPAAPTVVAPIVRQG